ncbi:MAG: hypothetical protein WEB04_01465 [Dehalococcoidia bacterium]
MTDRPRPSFRSVISNWRESSLPVPKRVGVAMLNWSRRFRIPPRDCCGHPGDPGC